MTMRIILTLAALTLAGCATSREAYLPDGRKGYTVNCSGTQVTWNACFRKAGDLCQARGYDIVTRSGEQGASFVGTQYGMAGGTTANRSMLIACK